MVTTFVRCFRPVGSLYLAKILQQTTPSNLTNKAGRHMGRGYGKGESISFPSFFWDVLSQLTLETMVALWGATNDRDEQRHQQMPQWIPPTLTSSSSFSRFVIRPWSSGNWSANHTKQTLHSRLICCKIQSKPRHGTWVRYESRESKLQESVLSL